MALLPLLALFIIGGTAFLLLRSQSEENRQEYIHDRGSMVMPFDLDKTTHIFTQTDEGGIQKIEANDPRDAEQIALIRSHMQMERDLFENGDFSDPSALHGESMPGLTVLEQSSDAFQVEYSELPNGAQLTYLTDNPEALEALHMWFMAQLQDHGMDAMVQ